MRSAGGKWRTASALPYARGESLARTTAFILTLSLAAVSTVACAAKIGGDQSAAFPRHPIATLSPEAQSLFDAGLAQFYAFNFQEARTAFQRAARADPAAPMPYWGIALAEGPNYNSINISPSRERAAFAAIEAAHQRTTDSTPAAETGYIDALARQFTNAEAYDLSALARAYAAAMAALASANPDDPDATVLYAASLMNLHAWHLWRPDGSPEDGTSSIQSALEHVLHRWPNHVGANHFYIHLMEASPFPERALPSAVRLGTLVPPMYGHLLHMPAHIYQRTGDYSTAADAMIAAASADAKYLSNPQIENQEYATGYADHNLEFLAASAGMDGDFSRAMLAADDLATRTDAMEGDNLAVGYLVLLRSSRWRDIMALPAPAVSGGDLFALWHYARGCALAQLGKPAQAFGESRIVAQRFTESARNGKPALPSRLRGLDDLLLATLKARIATARGKSGAAIADWRRAVKVEDTLPYREPPVWYPVRESLGAALLLAGQPASAEIVFRADLANNKKNPRSLFGLSKALAAQGKNVAAAQEWQLFLQGWKGDPKTLNLRDF